MEKLVEIPVSSEQIFSGALLKVRRDIVQLPDNNSAVREWIDHPGAAAVVPVFENGDTVLVRQFRYAPRRTFLEVPAGKLDIPGESPMQVAARELREETGFIADDLTPIGAYYPCIGYSSEVIHCFVATGLTPGETAFSHGEFIEVVRMPLLDAIRRAREGDFDDMKTISALLRAANHLGL
ncbi:MAG: NUDIX hydrolase [Rhodothermales bacterium]|nr:NUDIX hydrolase [Rhodothermales bacterium]